MNHLHSPAVWLSDIWQISNNSLKYFFHLLNVFSECVSEYTHWIYLVNQLNHNMNILLNIFSECIQWIYLLQNLNQFQNLLDTSIKWLSRFWMRMYSLEYINGHYQRYEIKTTKIDSKKMPDRWIQDKESLKAIQGIGLLLVYTKIRSFCLDVCAWRHVRMIPQEVLEQDAVFKDMTLKDTILNNTAKMN